MSCTINRKYGLSKKSGYFSFTRLPNTFIYAPSILLYAPAEHRPGHPVIATQADFSVSK